MSVAVVSARTAGQVVLYLSPKQPVPILPHELHEHITADAWATRIPRLIRVGNRYNRPTLEGIWLILMFICALVVPIGLSSRILHALHNTDKADAIYQTKWITTAIFIGIVSVFLISLGIWKSVGQARLTKLIKQWEVEDARERAPGTFAPVWKAKLSTSLRSHTRLTITTPHVQTQTYFHAGAYMPSWINGPIDLGTNNGFHVGNRELQKPAMYGEVPLYGNGNHDRSSNGVLQPHGERGVQHYLDDKKGLEAVGN